MYKFNGNDVRRLRKDVSLSQKEFAKALGVSPSTIGKAESGHGIVSPEFNRRLNQFVMIANYLIGERWVVYRETVAEIDRLVEHGAASVISELPKETQRTLQDFHVYVFAPENV